MLRKIFTLLAVVGMALQANAIIWHCDHFNSEKMTCRINGWSGNQPSSGKLKIPLVYTNSDGGTYEVNEVAPNALNDLTEVTEIVIPVTLLAIGEAKKSNADHANPELDNFRNCHQLVKFTVEEGNPMFKTDTYGSLYRSDMRVLYKVPAKVAVTDGKYRVLDKCKYIIRDAFSNNTTIKELYLPSDMTITYNGGLNKATHIAKYHINNVETDQNLTLVNGCLVDTKGSYWGKPAFISCPPASAKTACKVTSDVVEIAPYAFANTKNLITVDLGSAETLNEKMFLSSSVEHVTIPKTVKYAAEGAMRNATNLRQLDILAPDLIVREDFAHNCPNLGSVTTKHPFLVVYSRAFMNCPSLKDFPLNAETEWKGDSILYKSGITRAVFKGTVNKDEWSYGDAMFANNSELTTIDLSQVDCSTHPFSIGTPYAKKCPELRWFEAPEVLWFKATYLKDMEPAFNTTNLSEIHLNTFFNITYTPQFRYTPIGDCSNFNPYVYVTVTKNRTLRKKDYASMPLRNLFQGVNGAKVVPNFFCDLYDPRKYSYANDQYDYTSELNGNGHNEYIADRGIYYVPGGCAANYIKVKESGRQVKEMYKFSVRKEGSKMIVKTWTGECDVKDLRLTINGTETIKLKLKEEYELPVAYKNVGELLLEYKFNGVEFSTLYPASFWDNGGIGSSIDDFNNPDTTAVEEIENEETLPYQIYNFSGVKVAEGEGEIETSSLPKGLYIVRRGAVSEKIKI